MPPSPNSRGFASANKAGRLHCHVAKLACHAVPARDEMPSRKNAGAQAFRDINGHRVLHAREASKPTLGQNDQVGGILDLHRQTRSSSNCLRNVERSPAKVGGKAKRPVRRSTRPGTLMPTPWIAFLGSASQTRLMAASKWVIDG